MLFSTASTCELAVQTGPDRLDLYVRRKDITAEALARGLGARQASARDRSVGARPRWWPISRGTIATPFDRGIVALAMTGPVHPYIVDPRLGPYTDPMGLV
ncbi:MAG TPA: hypothetical protein VMB34_10785 [Acetobacteraceae bacterium]|nr:hypothetical protein [Acetobacteraceae bacterium]